MPVAPAGAAVGGGEETTNEEVAGVASTFPAGSTAWILNVCGAFASPVTVVGLVQAAKAALSSEQANVAVASGEVKTKVALVTEIPAAGPEVSVVSGATVSTVHVATAGVGSLPKASVETTLNVWEPSARPVTVTVLVQLASAPPSREHWKVAAGSVEANPIVAEVDFVGVGGACVIVVSGAPAAA